MKSWLKVWMKKEKGEIRTRILIDKIATSWVINYIKLPRSLNNGRQMQRVQNQGLKVCELIMMSLQTKNKENSLGRNLLR